MNSLDIWLLQTGEPYPIRSETRKMRTALLADQCVGRGHRVYWWGSAFEHQNKYWLSRHDTTHTIGTAFSIRLLRGCGYQKNVSLRRYVDHCLVARKFRKQSLAAARPDIIVASMPCYHLAYEGMRYTKAHQIPYMVDIRDLWPDIFVDALKRYHLGSLAHLFLRRDFEKLGNLLKYADSIVAISNGCLNWALKKAGRSAGPRDRVFYHGYRQQAAENSTKVTKVPLEFRHKKAFLFVGTFGKSYELDLILSVAKRFHNQANSDILFYLAGAGEQFSHLKTKASDLPNVILPGWIDTQTIQAALNSGWAGIVPCRSIENAAPNKVFEYLSAGLPLISSLEGEIANLIEQHQIGLNYRTGDINGLYNCVKKLSDESDLHRRMSASAMALFKEIGDADKIYSDYAEHIENVAARSGK